MAKKAAKKTTKKKTAAPAEPVEEGSDDDRHVLDLASFTSPERLECQVHFDATFGDLIRLLKEAVLPGRPGPSEMRIEGASGRVFPDQVAQYMLWVQTRRDDPDVELEDFDHLSLAQVQGAFAKGLVGKGGRSTRQRSSSPESSSAGSTQE